MEVFNPDILLLVCAYLASACMLAAMASVLWQEYKDWRLRRCSALELVTWTLAYATVVALIILILYALHP